MQFDLPDRSANKRHISAVVDCSYHVFREFVLLVAIAAPLRRAPIVF
jgi:hypothetical protein